MTSKTYLCIPVDRYTKETVGPEYIVTIDNVENIAKGYDPIVAAKYKALDMFLETKPSDKTSWYIDAVEITDLTSPAT
jgi:hypothetical protein